MASNSSLVQVVRFLEDGSPLYAWRSVQDSSPDPGEILWLPEGQEPSSDYKPYTMELSFRGTQSGLAKGQWGTCYTCLEDEPLNQMARIKGHWYCYKNGCAQEQMA